MDVDKFGLDVQHADDFLAPVADPSAIGACSDLADLALAVKLLLFDQGLADLTFP